MKPEKILNISVDCVVFGYDTTTKSLNVLMIKRYLKDKQKILEMVDEKNKENCQKTIDVHLEKAQKALDQALQSKEFADETRSQALAFSGEILMSHVMNHILKSNGIKSI